VKRKAARSGSASRAERRGEFSRRGTWDNRAVGVRPADELLRLPVRLHGIQLGRPIDVLLDGDAQRVLGLDVLCGDEVHRFLPLAAAEVGDEEITVRSALLLLDDVELAFYRTQGRTLRGLRGTDVELDRDEIGRLRDLEVGTDGSVGRLLLEVDGAERWVEHDGARFVGSVRAA
jgi:hypothetical protein